MSCGAVGGIVGATVVGGAVVGAGVIGAAVVGAAVFVLLDGMGVGATEGDGEMVVLFDEGVTEGSGDVDTVIVVSSFPSPELLLSFELSSGPTAASSNIF